MNSNQVGVVTFYSSYHAVQAEKVLKTKGFDVKSIPGPKDISPNCGVALQFNYEEKDLIEQSLIDKNVTYEALHLYQKPKEKKSLLDKFLGK
ncbi:hypothetical protein GGQ84_002375 [Desulfitispora alkaliphila]|uniref:DUF3343 domain-containing protein n=1 Tax=Desulfitispora alkaliphila TaxID=622674 RepID=UPI003D19808A